MGYDVHITRAEDWADSDANPIPLEEWIAYAADDPALSREGPWGDDSAAPGFFNLRVGDVATWLDWHEGEIFTKHPPPPVIAKMHAIAQSFGAHVQGDEGEAYDEHGQQVGELEENEPPGRAEGFFVMLLIPPLFAVLNSPLVGSLCVLAIIGGVTSFIASWFVFEGTTLALALVGAVAAVVVGYAGAISGIVA